MDRLYCPGLYFLEDIPSNAHLTIFDVVLALAVGVFLITSLVFILEKWYQEQLKEMEEKIRQLEFQLAKK